MLGQRPAVLRDGCASAAHSARAQGTEQGRGCRPACVAMADGCASAAHLGRTVGAARSPGQQQRAEQQHSAERNHVALPTPCKARPARPAPRGAPTLALLRSSTRTQKRRSSEAGSARPAAAHTVPHSPTTRRGAQRCWGPWDGEFGAAFDNGSATDVNSVQLELCVWQARPWVASFSLLLDDAEI